MTLWLDEMTVESYLVSELDVTARTEVSHSGDRSTITVIYQDDTITLSQFDLNDIQSYLSAIGDCDPELSITTEGGNLAIQVTADSDGFRDE